MLPELGAVDREAGEFWYENPFQIATNGENLSAFEHNCLFMNLDGQQFIDSSFASGADIDSDSRSVIATDMNNDGSIDLLVGSVGGGPVRLFLNQMPQQNRLRMTLAGRASNLTGIGTRIIIRAGDRQIVRDVFPANGFMGQAPAHLDLGVGDATTVDLTVRWPSGRTQSLQSVDTGVPLSLVEPDED
ncbi:MAG: ASPIC/UnbV domain-containing protein [Planctomycetaceae bacterium]